MGKLEYRRILLKISGDFFKDAKPINLNSFQFITDELEEVHKIGIEIGVVVGGGNIIRGASLDSKKIKRCTADYMGMVATIINSIALRDSLKRRDIKSSVYSALEIKGVASIFDIDKALEDLKEKKVVLFAGGTGNPYFTTDTAAALRALEIKADCLLKGTKVDGIYDKDPALHPEAKKFDFLTYKETLTRNLKVMDLTAITLCQEHNLPVIVFKMNEKGNLKRLIMGENLGTKLWGGEK